MAFRFNKSQISPLWKRIHTDDSTRLRLKYDTYYHIFDKQEGTRVFKDGKEFIMLSSNDYLGLTHHPKVKEAGKQAIEKWGASTTGARLANGGRIFHRELEEELENAGMEGARSDELTQQVLALKAQHELNESRTNSLQNLIDEKKYGISKRMYHSRAGGFALTPLQSRLAISCTAL